MRQILAWAGVRNGQALSTAAWLHDVVEDTHVSLEQVRDAFGSEVAEVVWAVTGVGGNRKERNASAYAKIKAAEAKGLPAASLKLADRIANVEASSKSAPDKFIMYQKEWPSFRDALAGHGMPVLWARLEAALGIVK